MPLGGPRRDEPEPDAIRVLHVDDEPEFLELAEAFLERADEHLDVVTATSADDALDVLAAEPVDCVVSDYEMPGRNGIEFLEDVREHHATLPFLLFTGKGSEEIASEAISAGVTDYLQKGGPEQYELLANRIENVVDRERSKRRLDERNRRLETLIQNLPGMVYRCRNEPEWPMEFVGGEVEALSGYTAADLESGEVAWGEDVIRTEDTDRVWKTVQNAVEAGDPFELTYRVLTRDGAPKWVWERGRGIRDEAGDLEALEGFITDVTDRKRRERELAEKNARLEALFENSPDMILVHDEFGAIVDANRRLCEELGYDTREVVGMPVWDVDEDAEPDGLQEMRASTTVGDVWAFDATFVRSDGSRLAVDAHLAQLDIDGEERYMVISRTANSDH